MIFRGVVRNGVVVPEPPAELPEGAHVRLEIESIADDAQSGSRPPCRQGGWLKGQIHLSPDFDELPDDIRHAFGMNSA